MQGPGIYAGEYDALAAAAAGDGGAAQGPGIYDGEYDAPAAAAADDGGAAQPAVEQEGFFSSQSMSDSDRWKECVKIAQPCRRNREQMSEKWLNAQAAR